MKKIILSVLISMSMFAFGCSSGGDGSSSNNPPTLINPVNPDSTANNSFKISSVVTAGSTVYAITEDGRLYAWGYNYLGNGTTAGIQTTPYEVTSVGKVKSVEICGVSYDSTVYAITEDGRLYAWGYNRYGLVGNGESGIDENGDDIVQATPYEVKEVGKVKSVVTAVSTVYAITEDNRLYAWGYNYYGLVGNGTTTTQTTPYEVKEVGKVKSVTGYTTVYAITEDNRLYAWGQNEYGQVGNGTTRNVVTTPYEVTQVGKVKSVTGGSTVYAITEDNRLYAWGDNEYGEVGNGEIYTTQTTPYEVKEVGKVKSVEIYGSTVYAITEDGRLYAWGDNEYGEVGNGATIDVTTPYEVTSVGKVKSVEIILDTVYAITEDGRLYAWGWNRCGLVGNGESGIDENGDYIVQTTPYEVKEVGKVKSVVTDSSTVYAITEDGRLYAWGCDSSSQVGNGTTRTQTTPYELTSIVGKVKSVISSGATAYAITEDGRLYAWGANISGQVGHGTRNDVTTPYEVVISKY